VNQPSDPGDLAFAARCKGQWDAHVDRLDTTTQGRLARARARVLVEAGGAAGARTFRVPGMWLPAAVCATAALLAMAVWVSRPVAVTKPLADAAPMEDAELLASDDEPDLYSEDPAFYVWAGSDMGAG
jgi:hypothetical protein